LPVVRPLTVIGLAFRLRARAVPPLDDVHVTVKVVIADPLFAPGVNDTVSEDAENLRTVNPVGAEGAPTTTDTVDAEAGPVPRTFVAVTEHV